MTSPAPRDPTVFAVHLPPPPETRPNGGGTVYVVPPTPPVDTIDWFRRMPQGGTIYLNQEGHDD